MKKVYIYIVEPIVEPHPNLIGKFEPEPNLILAKPEPEPELCDLGCGYNKDKNTINWNFMG